MSFIKCGNKRSLWYCVRRRNNPQSGMLKFWKVCKSRKFRPSINLQPTKKIGKTPCELVLVTEVWWTPFLRHFKPPEAGIWGCRRSVSPEGGTMTWPGLMGRPDTRLGHGKAQRYQRLFIIKENAFICWWHPETMSRNTKQRVGEREGEGKPGIISAGNWMKCWEEGDYFAH